MEPARGGEDDGLALLRQARDRADRLSADLARTRLELDKPCRAVPGPVLAEGEAAFREAADAASRLLGQIEGILRGGAPTSTSPSIDQGLT